MKAELLNHMGDDLMVVNAARVSFDKESEWEPLDVIKDPSVAFSLEYGGKLSDQDAKLINYLAKHGHWSPFSHPQLTFRIKAPIFVARQLGKHQVGLAWNEVSRRYVDSEPEFYTPDVWRKRADNVKQGSSDEEVDKRQIEPVEVLYGHALEVYEQYIKAGVCPEQARMVLPQSMFTEWYWTGSLYAFARVCKLRLDPHSQKETQEIAKQISEQIAPLFPVSWKALMDS